MRGNFAFHCSRIFLPCLSQSLLVAPAWGALEFQLESPFCPPTKPQQSTRLMASCFRQHVRQHDVAGGVAESTDAPTRSPTTGCGRTCGRRCGRACGRGKTPGTRLMPCPRRGWRPSRSRRARARLGAIHPQLDGCASAPPSSARRRAELRALALAGARLPALISAATMPGVPRALRSEHRLTPRWGAPFPSHALGRVSALSPLRCCAPTLRTISRWGGKLVYRTKPHRAHAAAPCEDTLSAKSCYTT